VPAPKHKLKPPSLPISIRRIDTFRRNDLHEQAVDRRYRWYNLHVTWAL